MSASARACQFYVDERSLIQPQFPMKHKEVFTSSDIEYPSFKKPRISATLPYPSFQTVLNEARTRNVKTQLCRKFRVGICTLGSRCNYAHCIGELRRQDNLTKEYPLAETFGGDYKALHEPQLCRMFFQGKQCSYGHSCRFLHVRHDSINSRERPMIEMIPTGAVGHGKSESGQLEFKRVSNANFDPEVNPKRLLLKTRLCNKWEIKGYCPFGKICRFAHGQAELGKLDGYASSEYRVLQTSKANTTTNASNSITATGPLLKKEPYPINCKFRRKELHKISRIYGDWI